MICFLSVHLKWHKYISYAQIRTFASLWIADVQIPVERFALIANASSNAFFALAQFTGWHRAAAREARCDTGWIAIALFACWEIVETFFAFGASFAVEIAVAQALTLRITGDTDRARRFTVAS